MIETVARKTPSGTGVTIAVLALLTLCDSVAGAEELTLEVRSRTRPDAAVAEWNVQESALRWNPSETALLICDMWRKHWCLGATRRGGQMAPRMNQVANALREKGVLVIHAPSPPSDESDLYRDWPQRQASKAAPPVKMVKPPWQPPQGWRNTFGPGWCATNMLRESPLPVDHSDDGCDCLPQCKNWAGKADSRQIEAIQIKSGDIIAGANLEALYVMEARSIKNVLIMGVHLNLCMMGRPFGIRNLVYQGRNVVLLRDLTDSLYNPRMPPFVSHQRGTELMVEHIEQYWCPSITSAQILGGTPFVFPGLKESGENPDQGHEAASPVGGTAEWRMRHAEVLAEIKNLQRDCDLLLLGDSITRGWRDVGKKSFPDAFRRYTVINGAIAGSQTQHILWQLDHGLTEARPRGVILMAGVNNVLGSPAHRARDIAHGMHALIAKLRERLPECEILLLATFPAGRTSESPERRKVVELNELLAKLGKIERVRFLDLTSRFLTKDGSFPEDLSPDGIHLTAEGYRIWAEALRPTLQACWPVEEAQSAVPRLDRPPLRFASRRRIESDDGGDDWKTISTQQRWAPNQTALVICDMWREHWCKGTARRTALLGPPIDRLANRLREQGVLIVHAPSCPTRQPDHPTNRFYQDYAQRQLARAAPPVQLSLPRVQPPPRWDHIDLSTAPWGAPNLRRESNCPIYDPTGTGCDCTLRCKPFHHDTRQVESIAIAPEDAIVGDNLEALYLFKQRGIKNVLVAGVSLNVCMMGRPFGIRNLVYQDYKVALMRDLTDSLYDPRQPPHVDHHRGTEIMTEHIERFWCSSITSDQFTGGKPFSWPAAN